MNLKLKNKLKVMAEKDQLMRSSGNWDREIDIENCQELKRVIGEIGWPDFDIVDREGACFAWLIVQHADHDLVFQENCLALMKEKISQNKIDKKHYAYLVDRVRKNSGKKQIYGTQFYVENGCFVEYPILDKANLNKKRKEFGLIEFSKYKKRLEKRQRKLK